MELFGLGAPELLLILFVLLLFFGKDKLPELARSIGNSVRELKGGFTNPAPPTTTPVAPTETTQTTQTTEVTKKSKSA